MALEFSGYFDSTASEERNYSASELAVVFRALGGTGVTSFDVGLQVSAEGSTMRTLVAPGLAMILGYPYELQDDGGGQMAFTHAASAGSDRIDRIVLQLDLGDDPQIKLRLLTGTPGASPQPPALTHTPTMYQISLANVRVNAGASEILPAGIKDERPDETVCGALVPEAVKLSTLWARMTKPAATGTTPGLMPAADKAYVDKLRTAVTVTDTALDVNGRYLDNALFR